MILYSQIKPYAIITNAKCGCTTVMDWFIQHNEGIRVDNPHEFYKEKLKQVFRETRYYKLVRNPEDRIVSFINNKIYNPKALFYRPGKSVEDVLNMIKKDPSRNAHFCVQYEKYEPKAKVFRMEDGIDIMFQSIEQEFDLPRIPADHRNKQEDKIITMLSPYHSMMVKEIYYEDYQAYYPHLL